MRWLAAQPAAVTYQWSLLLRPYPLACLPARLPQRCGLWAPRITSTSPSLATRRCHSWSGQRCACFGTVAVLQRECLHGLGSGRSQLRAAQLRRMVGAVLRLCSAVAAGVAAVTNVGWSMTEPFCPEPLQLRGPAGAASFADASCRCQHAPRSQPYCPPCRPATQVFLYPIGGIVAILPLSILLGLNPTSLMLKWYFPGR